MDDRARWAVRGGWGVGRALALFLLYQLRGLHRLVVMIVVLAAGWVLGVLGILFAVPAAAVLRVLIPELWTLAQEKQVRA